MVILITGKKDAGKTHYAKALVKELEEQYYKVILLDGDALRKETDNLDFSDEGRIKNLKKAAELAASFEEEGFIVVLSFIAPRKKWRNMMRKYWEVSRIVYLPGGTLWKGTTYDIPAEEEYDIRHNFIKNKVRWPEQMWMI
jgi:adenylylsulfate kinase-like enzyme